MKRSSKAKKAKLYVFPGGKENKPGLSGPVWQSSRLYRCKNCGNTRIFYGHAFVPAVLTISAVSPFRYDVVEYAIPEEEDVEHFVATCAECGSSDIEAYEVDIMATAMHNVNDKEGVWTRIMLAKDVLPPHERDVVQGHDGNWYVGCERTRDYLTLDKFREQTKSEDKQN